MDSWTPAGHGSTSAVGGTRSSGDDTTASTTTTDAPKPVLDRSRMTRDHVLAPVGRDDVEIVGDDPARWVLSITR